MNVLLLSPYPDEIWYILRAADDAVTVCEDKEWPTGPFDFVVSYGYRHIIKEPMLSEYRGRLINIHIGYLPFNRGAHPAFWAAFDGTPQGVTVHLVDEGIDTGPILCQERLWIDPHSTLQTAHRTLRSAVADLIQRDWWLLRATGLAPTVQEGWSVPHKTSDLPYLPKGWETTLSEVAKMGRKHREAAA
jgi:methionyl-tRNA formyltransferase